MNSQFNTCATEYHKFRPDYPMALFELLIERFKLSNTSLIADVGCGTARASIAFAQQNIKVIGLDPSLEMLQLGRKTSQDLGLQISFLQSSAEEIALSDKTIDFINCAQAFHWFNSEKAFNEFKRILKPTAGFALYWNNRDQLTASYLAEVEELITKYNPKYKSGYQSQDWGQIIKDAQLFTDIEFYSFSHSEGLSIEDFIGLTRSFSYVRNVLSDEDMSLFTNELESLLIKNSVNNQLQLPYQVKLWCAKISF
ncbi:MAG: class I SAM-dependent methyltransferase [Blastocatellia bacterium]